MPEHISPSEFFNKRSTIKETSQGIKLFILIDAFFYNIKKNYKNMKYFFLLGK